MINFKDRQVLNFEDGLNFLIGANATGKSSILELIRRCHSKRLNSSSSNLQDKTKPGFIICKYEISSKENGWDVELLCHFQEKNNNGSNVMYKCVFFRGEDGNICITASREDHIGVLEQISRINIGSDFEELDNFLNICFKQENADGELRLLDQIKLSLQNPTLVTDISSSHTEKRLDTCSRAFAFIFADRSFGPLQWINGNTVKNLDGKANYDEAQNRADILRQLLPLDEDEQQESIETDTRDESGAPPQQPFGQKDEGNESDQIEWEKEKSYFDLLTYPLRYVFKRSEQKIKVKIENDEREVEFVKAPEGVIEAKQASLVFSHSKFKTICYEDIERGMHDQMIEKMNNLVLKKIVDKTIIIVTHNPSFMNKWTMERTHICLRDNSLKELNVVTCKKLPSGLKRNSETKKAIFAANVLLVEGSTDQYILQSLFDYIIHNQQHQTVLRNLLKMEEPLLVQRICTTQIIPFGEKMMKNGKKFCGDINISCFTLLDRDEPAESDSKYESDFKWGKEFRDIEGALMNDCPDATLKIVNKTRKRGREGEKSKKTYEKIPEGETSKKAFKKNLKDKIKDNLEEETINDLFDELFKKIHYYEKERDFENLEKLAFFTFLKKYLKAN